MSLPTVAIAGATGHLGQHVTDIILSPNFRPLFQQVILLSRKPTSDSPLLQRWQSQDNCDIRVYNEENLSNLLADADVLVNVIGSEGHKFKDQLVRALPNTNVKLYMPSEFGVDHTVHDFAQPEWDFKKAHAQLARTLKPDMKICRIYTGLFMEDCMAPFLGFDTKGKKYECVGSKDMQTSYTGLDDIGRTVATLAAMPVDKVPETMRISGDAVSTAEIARLMSAAGAGDIQVSELDLEEYKQTTIREAPERPFYFLRFIMGEGKLKHTPDGIGCENDVVNPQEAAWRWKRMSEYVQDLQGKAPEGYESK